MRIWHFFAFLVLLGVFAAALTPISVIAPSRLGAFAYDRADGSAFDARFSGARAGVLDLGAATWRFAPEALLRGEFGGRVSFTGGAINGAGEISVGVNNGARIAAGEVSLSPVWRAPSGLSVGDAQVRDLLVRFAGDACIEARGDAVARFGVELGVESPLPDLLGRVTCVGQNAELRLAGERDGVAVEIVATAAASGEGAWRMTVGTGSPTVLAAATALGFTQSTGAGQALREGTFRWRP